MVREKMVDRVFRKLLSATCKEKSERIILVIAIISYVIHLGLIVLVNRGLIPVEAKFLQNPIAAIYTPFSFILLYEVYLLIFFLPQSITVYIGKQYEIITLIVIRRIFKDIANITLTPDWVTLKTDLQFTYDVVSSLVLFSLIYLFYQNNPRKAYHKIMQPDREGKTIQRFVDLKKVMAIILVPILLMLAVYTLVNWARGIMQDYSHGIMAFKNINNVFFDEFFTILIIVDVLLLLTSFFYSDQFHKIIRNSGFVISTILIKMSFSVEGIVNNALIIGAVLFGLLILIMHNRYENKMVTISQ